MTCAQKVHNKACSANCHYKCNFITTNFVSSKFFLIPSGSWYLITYIHAPATYTQTQTQTDTHTHTHTHTYGTHAHSPSQSLVIQDSQSNHQFYQCPQAKPCSSLWDIPLDPWALQSAKHMCKDTQICMHLCTHSLTHSHAYAHTHTHTHIYMPTELSLSLSLSLSTQ